MAVLVEAISIIVRRDAIAARFSGGWHQFLAIVPNSTLCFDEDLARVGFMSPPDVEAFVRHLENGGLTFAHDGQAVDIAVVDQMHGPTMPAEWLEVARLFLDGTENKVAACWLFDGSRIAAGVHIPANGVTLATPDGWTYDDSLSANFKFAEIEEIEEKLKFMRHENGMDVYLNRSTGEEVYVGRPQV